MERYYDIPYEANPEHLWVRHNSRFAKAKVGLPLLTHIDRWSLAEEAEGPFSYLSVVEGPCMVLPKEALARILGKL